MKAARLTRRSLAAAGRGRTNRRPVGSGDRVEHGLRAHSCGVAPADLPSISTVGVP